MKLTRDITTDGTTAPAVDIANTDKALLREKELVEAASGLMRGIADMKAGRVRDSSEVFKDMEAKYHIPSV